LAALRAQFATPLSCFRKSSNRDGAMSRKNANSNARDKRLAILASSDGYVASIMVLDGCRSIRFNVLVLFRQHDGDDALGDRGVCRIGGVEAEGFVEIVDLEHDVRTVKIKGTKVVFAVGVAGLAKVVVGGNGLDDEAGGSARDRRQCAPVRSTIRCPCHTGSGRNASNS
jgi:hypothetical protein